MRHKSPRAYLTGAASTDFLQTDEAVTGNELSGEFMMNVLRLNEGFDIQLYQRHTGLPWIVVSRQVDSAVADGFLTWIEAGKRLQPTPLGRRFLNVLLERFI